MELSCLLGTPHCIPQEKFPRKPYDNPLLTKLVRSRWLDIGQVLFACLWTETMSRSIPSHLDRINLVNKGFIIWLRGNFSCGIQRLVPRGQDGSILRARVANHSAGFGSSCSLTEPAISVIIKNIYIYIYILSRAESMVIEKTGKKFGNMSIR